MVNRNVNDNWLLEQRAGLVVPDPVFRTTSLPARRFSLTKRIYSRVPVTPTFRPSPPFLLNTHGMMANIMITPRNHHRRQYRRVNQLILGATQHVHLRAST